MVHRPVLSQLCHSVAECLGQVILLLRASVPLLPNGDNRSTTSWALVWGLNEAVWNNGFDSVLGSESVLNKW